MTEEMLDNIDPDYKPLKPVELAKLRIIATSIHILPYSEKYYLMTVIGQNAEYAKLIEIDRIKRLITAVNIGIEYELSTDTLMAYVYSSSIKKIKPARIIIAATKNTKIHFYSEVSND